METCKLCNKQFHSKRMMRRHLAANHPDAKNEEEAVHDNNANTPGPILNGPSTSAAAADVEVAAVEASPAPTPEKPKKRPYNRKSKPAGEDKSNQTEVECGVCQEKVSDPSTHKCSLLETTLKLNTKGEVIGEIMRPKLPRLITINPISPTSKKPPSSLNPKTGWYQCSVCGKEFPREKTFQHHYKSIHLQLRLQCNFCGKEFHVRSEYNRHHRDSHMGIRFKCELCDKMFPLKTALLEHRQKDHANEEPNGMIEDEGEQEQPQAHSSATATPPKPKVRKPPQTTTITQIIKSLARTSTSTATASPSGNGLNNSANQNGILEGSSSASSPPKLYKCDICDKTFTHKSNLGTHKQSIHLGITYPCPTCPKIFRSASNRRQHMRLNKCNQQQSDGDGSPSPSKQPKSVNQPNEVSPNT